MHGEWKSIGGDDRGAGNFIRGAGDEVPDFRPVGNSAPDEYAGAIAGLH